MLTYSEIKILDNIAGGFTSKETCGEKVAHCLADVYTNHGWASVGAIITSSFWGGAGTIAYVVACYAEVCKGIDLPG